MMWINGCRHTAMLLHTVMGVHSSIPLLHVGLGTRAVGFGIAFYPRADNDN